MAEEKKPAAPFKASITVESRQGGKVTESQRNMPLHAVIAKGLRKTYSEGDRELQVLKGINLEIETGEIAALVGPSGAGKSTLLNLFGLMDHFSGGELTVLGWETGNLKEKEKDGLRNKYIGFMFQFHHLLPELTLLENAALPLRIAGLNEKQAGGRAEELLSSLGLKERLGHLPSQVSGGEQQRTALARAMINRPGIRLCDEPKGNLVVEMGEEIRDLIWKTARSEHSTVLIATHNPDIAKSADRIIRIVDGNIVQK